MKTRYYIKIVTLGSDDKAFVTSDDESKIKKIWRNLFKRWLDRGVLDFTDHRFTFRVNGFVKFTSTDSPQMTYADMRAKCIKDIWRQQERCRDTYHTFDNTKPPTKWLKKAFEISRAYMDNIAKSHPNSKYDEKFSYQTRIGQ